MAKKRSGVVSDLEVPNPGVFETAQDFHNAARLLARGQERPPLLLPFYTVGAFALEAYLKSLNSPWNYPNLVEDEDGNYQPSGPSVPWTDHFLQTAQPTTISHDLVELFNGLEETFRKELITKFEEEHVLLKGETFVAALERFKNAFVHSRYIFEHQRSLPTGPAGDLLTLLDFLGKYVEGKHNSNPRQIHRERMRAKFAGERSSQRLELLESEVESSEADRQRGDHAADVPAPDETGYFGRIDGDDVLLDSAESLDEETIFSVEPVLGSSHAEIGVVKGGIIRLEWSGSIADKSLVRAKRLGKLLGLDEVAPFYKIGELASDPRFADADIPDSPAQGQAGADGR